MNTNTSPLSQLISRLWAWVGRVSVGLKLTGIALIAMLFPASALVWWLINNPTFLNLVVRDDRFPELVIFVLAMTTLGLVLAYVMIKTLTSAIQDVARVARLVESGRLSERAPVWASDEIGEMGRAFNAMIDTLSTAQQELEASNQQLREGNQDLSVLYTLAEMSNRSPQISTILNSGLARVIEVVNAQAGVIALYDEQSVLMVRTAHNLPNELQARLVPELIAQLLASAEGRDQPWTLSDCAELRGGDAWPHAGVLCLPIKTRGETLGVFLLFMAGDDALSIRGASFLQAVAHQIGIAVKNFSLWEELKRKEAIRARLLAQAVTAQEQERGRISRELHDETGQSLTALLVQLKVLENLRDVEAVGSLARELRELVVQTLEEVRRLARDLRPSTLDDLGLVPTLGWYIQAYRKKTGLDIELIVDLPENLRLRPLTELILYRVVQEALTNITRHANATRVVVQLDRHDTLMRLTVEDDGVGFDVSRTLDKQDKSLGLLGMHERAELIGATLRLDSIPGQGTRLKVEVALADAIEEVTV